MHDCRQQKSTFSEPSQSPSSRATCVGMPRSMHNACKHSGDYISQILETRRSAWLEEGQERTSTPHLTLKKPSGVRSPVQKALSSSSMSDVSSEAESASVRAMSTVGTSATSAARRAATSVRMKWLVGISTLPAAEDSSRDSGSCSEDDGAALSAGMQMASCCCKMRLLHGTKPGKHGTAGAATRCVERCCTWQQSKRRTAEVAALLLGGQLVLEVHAGRASLDHGLSMEHSRISA